MQEEKRRVQKFTMQDIEYQIPLSNLIKKKLVDYQENYDFFSNFTIDFLTDARTLKRVDLEKNSFIYQIRQMQEKKKSEFLVLLINELD